MGSPRRNPSADDASGSGCALAEGHERAISAQLIRLRRRLSRLEPLAEITVTLPRSGHAFRLLRPLDVDRLLDEAERDPEEQLPYWAELWPSGIALADTLSLEPETVRGVSVLELGCGLGLTAAAALRAGAELVATDYAPEALLLTRLNCLANTGLEPSTLRLNWRRPPARLLAASGGVGFPVVLAADVLYEERDVEPLFRLAGQVVAPGGLLWLAEPGRRAAARFLELARAAGWGGPAEIWDGPWPDPLDARVRVTVHRLRRPRAPRSGDVHEQQSPGEDADSP